MGKISLRVKDPKTGEWHDVPAETVTVKFTGALRPGAQTRDRREEGMSEWSEFELAPNMSLSAAMQMMQLDHWLGEIEKSARACLAEHGIEGNWLRASEEAERRFGKGSLPWFAAEMWGDAQGVHRARARGDAKNQEWHAFQCGCAFTEWRLKVLAEREVVKLRSDRRVQKISGKLALERRRRRAARWHRAAEAEAKKLRAAYPDKAKSRKWLAGTIKAKHRLKVKWETIAAYLRKLDF